MKEYKNLISSIDRLLKASDDLLSDTLKEGGFTESKLTVDEINSLEDALAGVFEEQRDYFVNGLKGKDVEQAMEDTLPSLLDGDLTELAIAEVFKNIFPSFMQNIVDSYIQGIDKDLGFSMFTERTTNWIESWSEELGRLMKPKVHENIGKIFTNALKNGDGMQTVINNLMEDFGFSRERARTTAITEMLTAHSHAAYEAYLQSPAVSQKMWRHTGVAKEPRLNHVNMDGTIEDVNLTFTLPGADGNAYYPHYPRDPILPAGERINCHCMIQPVVSEDILGLSLEERQRLQQEAIEYDNRAWEAELDAQNRAKAGIE